jgi:hypothetical protein
VFRRFAEALTAARCAARPSRTLLAVLLICAAPLLAGCEATTESSSSGADSSTYDDGRGIYDDSSDELVEVPDVTDEDGADAVSSLEDAGFSVSLTEDDGRDATGCTVTDQDPIGEAEDGADIQLTLDCRQIDWDNQTGEDWDAFNEAYSTGWDEGCDEAFDNSPDGSLYYDGEEFTSMDCQGNNPGDATSADIPADVPDDPTVDGEELGVSDGCASAFDDLSPEAVLYYGEDGYDSSYCP